MLLDVSPSMSKWLADLGAKSTDALRALRSGDEVALMGFAARSQLLQPLTTDTKSLGAQIIGNIYKQTLGSETLVNEALLEAANYMRQSAGKSAESDPDRHRQRGREKDRIGRSGRSRASCGRYRR